MSVAVDNETGDVYVADQGHRVIDKFDAAGKLIASFGDSVNPVTKAPQPDGQLAGLATPAASFSAESSLAIAVDQATHDLYVVDSGPGHQVVDVFDSEGHFLPAKQITATPIGLYAHQGGFADSIAVNASTAHVFLSESWTEAVFEFDALGNPVGEAWTGAGAPSAFGGSLSVAVNDASGDIYVSGTFPGPAVDRFNEKREWVAPQLARTSGVVHGGVSVDQASGHLFVTEAPETSAPVVNIFGGAAVLLPDVRTAAASAVLPRSVTLNGTVNPDGVEASDCHFEYVASAQFQPSAFDPYAAGASVPCLESVGSGGEEVPVHADLAGLQVGTTYHFRLVAANANGNSPGADETVATVPAPAITAASATGLTSTAVDLNASVNPGGKETTCLFEYGENTEYGHELPCESQPGAGSTNVPVSVHVSGLEHDRTYHWRLVANNEAGTTNSFDHTFIYSTVAGGLPDGRAYEMVTPPHKNGALIGDVALGLVPDVAETRSGLTLPSLQCFGDAQSCVVNRELVGTNFQFERTLAGWQSRQLSPPAQSFEVSTVWSVDAETGDALVSMPTPPHNEDDLYVHRPDGSFTDVGPVTPPEEGRQGAKGAESAAAKAATADFSHYVWGEKFSAWPFDKTEGGKEGEGEGENGVGTLYEYVGTGNAQPLLVGVTGPRGSHDLVSRCGTELGGAATSKANPGALSADGRVVFFTALGGESQGGAERCFGEGANTAVEVPANTLYTRVGESETVKISGHGGLSECGPECQSTPASNAEFQGASVDGSRAFFTSTQRLTDAASEDPRNGDSALQTGCRQASGANGCNLYKSECVPAALQCGSATERRLVDVSAGDSSGAGPRVQGVMAASADGSHVYFVARGVLTKTANNEGHVAVAGEDNLYVFDGAATSFVTVLPPSDDTQGVHGQLWSEGSSEANVTPDGRVLVFGSRAPLTPDTGTAGALQVFRYDAATGVLARISRGEGGFNDDGNNPPSTGCGPLAGVEPCAASIVAQDTVVSFGGSYRRDPTMSNDGEYIFFQSPLALTSKAADLVQVGVEQEGRPIYEQNVYEWHAGHVYLIFGGHDASLSATAFCGQSSAACLIGPDGSGHNVFFTTADRLLAQDTDTQLDFYDARVCTGAEPCLSPPPAPRALCDGEECHGAPPARASTAAGPTATFSGAGNATPTPRPVKPLTNGQKLANALRTCHTKHNRHRRRTCEKQAHKRYALTSRSASYKGGK